MEEFKLPEINNEIKITQEEWDKFQEDLRIAKFKLQEINDNLEGGLTSRNLASFRNTYVINAQDSLDATYSMYVHFNILDEMVKIVSVKVDFWILNYRAYSKAGAAAGTPSGGGATSGPTGSASGGGSTSGATSSASGGGETSGSGGGQTSSSESGTPVPVITSLSTTNVTNVGDESRDGLLIGSYGSSSCPQTSHTHTVSNHVHSTPNHTHPNHSHSTPNHTHPNHTHSTPNHTHPDHTHDAAYGIFEEETSPTIKFYVSENAGVSYSDVYGGYDADKSGINITSWLTKAGSKLIRFTSTTRARLSVQIEIKLDIRAR